MNYRFFEALSREEAGDYLDAFRHAGRVRVGDEWWSRLPHEGTASIRPYFVEVSAVLRVVQTPPPPDTPPVIVDAKQRDHGGFEISPTTTHALRCSGPPSSSEPRSSRTSHH